MSTVASRAHRPCVIHLHADEIQSETIRIDTVAAWEMVNKRKQSETNKTYLLLSSSFLVLFANGIQRYMDEKKKKGEREKNQQQTK